jgi:hypothetical protein
MLWDGERRLQLAMDLIVEPKKETEDNRETSHGLERERKESKKGLIIDDRWMRSREGRKRRREDTGGRGGLGLSASQGRLRRSLPTRPHEMPVTSWLSKASPV